MSRFDVCDGAQQGCATLDLTGFQDELFSERVKLIQAKQGDQPTAEAPEQIPQAQNGQEKSEAQKTVEATITAIAEELRARKEANGGTIGEADVREILPKYFPKFQEAVTQADTHFGETRTAAVAEMDKLKPELDRIDAQLAPVVEKFVKAAEMVSEADAESVDAKLVELEDPATAPERKAALEKELNGKYPGLVDSNREMNKILEDNKDVITKVEQLRNDLQNATIDSYQARVFYAQALLEGGGDPQAIERIGQELEMLKMLIMVGPDVHFVKPEDVQPPPPKVPVQKA